MRLVSINGNVPINVNKVLVYAAAKKINLSHLKAHAYMWDFAHYASPQGFDWLNTTGRMEHIDEKKIEVATKMAYPDFIKNLPTYESLKNNPNPKVNTVEIQTAAKEYATSIVKRYPLYEPDQELLKNYADPSASETDIIKKPVKDPTTGVYHSSGGGGGSGGGGECCIYNEHGGGGCGACR